MCGWRTLFFLHRGNKPAVAPKSPGERVRICGLLTASCCCWHTTVNSVSQTISFLSSLLLLLLLCYLLAIFPLLLLLLYFIYLHRDQFHATGTQTHVNGPRCWLLLLCCSLLCSVRTDETDAVRVGMVVPLPLLFYCCLTLQLMYDDAPGDDDGVMMGAAHRKHFIEGPVLFGSGRRLCSETCEFYCKPSTKIGNTCWIGRHSIALTLSSQCLRLSLIYEFLSCVRALCLCIGRPT